MNSQINLQTILAQRPLGLVFDIDGTLSPIAPTPEEARLYPGVASLLERAREHVHIAIVTGRAIEMSQLREHGLASLAIVVQHSDTLPELVEQADIVVHGK